MTALSVLLIDNFDSFTFNLVDEFERRHCQVEVWRNDVSAQHALHLLLARPAPRLLVLSPGPGSPAEAGCCIELLRLALGKVPTLGVCLGHQAMVEAFGGRVAGAGEIVHGKATPIHHGGVGVFAGLPSPMPVARYHSLVAVEVPDCLEVVARGSNLVMAVQHRDGPMLGVQFHPESILTPMGGRLLDNVLKWAGSFPPSGGKLTVVEGGGPYGGTARFLPGL